MTAELRVGLLAAALAAAFNVHAQTSGADQTVVVTATRVPQAAANLVTDVSVIGPQQLRGVVQGSLAQQLDQLAGIETTVNGGPGAATGVFIRGASSNQTLTLIEGFRIGSATLGSTSFQGLPATRFGRVEVLRGPASGLYGADAIGGVVQLFLPRGAGPFGAFADLGAGTQGTRAANAGVQGQAGAFDYAVSVGHARSDGFSATKPGNFSYHPDRDGYERSNASANLNFALAPGHELGLVAFSDRLRSEFDDGANFANAINKLQSQLVGLRSSHQLGQAVRLRLRAGDTVDRLESISRFPGAFRTKQRQLAADTEWTIHPSAVLGVGYERLEQQVESSSFAAPERTTDSLRASLFVNAAAHIVQLSARHDDSSQYGGRTTGSLAYGYRLTRTLRLGGGVSTGFRAPSFNDLYFPGFGRTAIRPETARNAELGAYWDSVTTRARAVVYRNQVRDLIVFAPSCPDPSPQFRSGCADNVNRARLEGISLELTHRIDTTRLHAALDFQRPRDETLDKRLPRRAARHAAFAVDQTIGQAMVGVEWLVSGERYDDAANRRRLGGFGVLNLRAEAPLTRELSVFARANNIFDKDYETASLFATPGANVFVGLRYASR